MMSKKFVLLGWCRAVCLYAVVAVVGLNADLLTKHWVFQALGMPGTYKADTEPDLKAVYWILPNVAGFQTSLNQGALFGLGHGHITILVVLSVLFLIGIMGYMVLWAWKSLFFSTVLGMITAGIFGNLYDRLGWHGFTDSSGQPVYAVRDWILCMIGSFPWPNFNIADSLLVCSVILLLLHELLFNSAEQRGALEQRQEAGTEKPVGSKEQAGHLPTSLSVDA